MLLLALIAGCAVLVTVAYLALAEGGRRVRRAREARPDTGGRRDLPLRLLIAAIGGGLGILLFENLEGTRATLIFVGLLIPGLALAVYTSWQRH